MLTFLFLSVFVVVDDFFNRYDTSMYIGARVDDEHCPK
jgi:hypothetical protein